MPSICECPRCERFRANLPESTLPDSAIKALQKANAPSVKSRRARIASGKGKNGGKESS